MFKAFVITIFLLFQFSSQAALHLEPLLYYGMGDSIEKNTNVEFKQQGLLYGARMGWYRNSFSLGLEYLTGQMEFENENTNQEYDETPHYMGAYMGYHLKKRFGLNLSYFLKVRSNSDINKLSGNAWKVELYYRIKTHVTFRIGYKHRTLDYDENTDTDLTNKFESKTVLAGFSFPWVL